MEDFIMAKTSFPNGVRNMEGFPMYNILYYYV
jgi:hypothetical protein